MRLATRSSEIRYPPQAKETKGKASGPRSIRRAALSIHANGGARNPRCHHTTIAAVDRAEGLAYQAAHACEGGGEGGLRGGRREGENRRESDRRFQIQKDGG